MKLWNVFRMEIFKNLHDRANLFIMLMLMCLNIIGGIIISNQNWLFREPSGFELMIIWLLVFSVLCTVAFLFIYPYQMARTDYKNNVMSLMIASGVSRVQYYFVKIGATLLFSFLSVTFLVIFPLLIVLIVNGEIVTAYEFADFYWNISDIGGVLGLLITGWLSAFSTLMTATIMTKGKSVTFFVFFGLLIIASQLAVIVQGILGINRWQASNMVTIVQYLITMAVMGLIGILILRKQDL